MRGLLVCLSAAALLAFAGCGDGGGDGKVIEVPTAEVKITKDCGYYGGMQESKVTAVETDCKEALGIANSINYAGCNFVDDPTCDVANYVCRRTSGDGADTFVAECIKGDATVTVQAPVVRE